jgi:outer membrane murein-binding lipoprotein Lpp
MEPEDQDRRHATEAEVLRVREAITDVKDEVHAVAVANTALAGVVSKTESLLAKIDQQQVRLQTTMDAQHAALHTAVMAVEKDVEKAVNTIAVFGERLTMVQRLVYGAVGLILMSVLAMALNVLLMTGAE